MFVTPCPTPPKPPLWETLPGLYGAARLGSTTARNVAFDPTDTIRKPLPEDTEAVHWGVRLGWMGPCKFNFNIGIYYQFDQSWRANLAPSEPRGPTGALGSGKGGLFPTALMARRHAWTLSPVFRKEMGSYELFVGLHADLEWAFTGSESLGGTGEVTRKLWVRENFVPYGAWVTLPWTFWLYSPLLTYIDGQTSQFNFSTFSVSPRGLGPRVSLGAGVRWGPHQADGSHVYGAWERRAERAGSVHLDRNRQGVLVGGYWEALPQWGLGVYGHGGYQEATYPIGWIVNSGSLQPTQNLPKTPTSDDPRAVVRYDGTRQWQVGVLWAGEDGQWQVASSLAGSVVRSNLPDFSHEQLWFSVQVGFEIGGQPPGPALPLITQFHGLFTEGPHQQIFLKDR